MSIDIIFKIAGIGILTAVINQILKLSGKEEIATFVTLAGIIIVLFTIRIIDVILNKKEFQKAFECAYKLIMEVYKDFPIFKPLAFKNV